MVVSHDVFGVHLNWRYTLYLDAPPHPSKQDLFDLWFNNEYQSWCYYNCTSGWTRVPEFTEQRRGFVTSFPGLRLKTALNRYEPPRWSHRNEKIEQKALRLATVNSANKGVLSIYENWLLQEVENPRIDDLFDFFLNYPLPLPFQSGIRDFEQMFPSSQPTMKNALATLDAWKDLISRGHLPNDPDFINNGSWLSTSIALTEFIEHYTQPELSSQALNCLGLTVSDPDFKEYPNSLFHFDITLPPHLRDDSKFHTFSNEELTNKPVVSGQWAMAGSYTSAHSDGIITSFLINHIGYGLKIWIFYNLNDDNEQVMCQFDLTDIGAIASGSIVHQCRSITDFKVLVTCKPTAFVIKPGQYHSVITLQQSFHLGTAFVSLRDFEFCMDKLKKWTGDWITACNNTSIESWPMKTELDKSGNIAKIFDGCLLWQSLLEEKYDKIPQSGRYMARFAAEVRNWLAAVDDKPKVCKENGDQVEQLEQFLTRCDRIAVKLPAK